MKQDTKVTAELVEEHGLTSEEYERIKKLLGRPPNITELGIFSVMWSEHCSYKSSKIYLKDFPTKGPRVIQGPGENAGIVDIGDGLAVVFKMESHNHPSFIEPYQGAATGVGGILRDVFTMGARPVANLNSLKFGQPDHPKTPYLLRGVVAGIAGYGNCIGVATVGGEVAFDESYNGNILVNAFTAGVVRQDKIFKGFAKGVGNSVVYVGSKTGRDGIHGATMASDVFGEGNEERRPTVQVGDPFTEKLLLEACLEAIETGAVVGMQDMGAAGLTSSSFEMASRAGTGIEMNLDKVPRRETGMTPYELMLSESQERMVLIVLNGREDEIRRIFEKWDLDAVVVGKVTDDGVMRVRSEGEIVVELPIAPLAHSAPVYERPKGRPAYQDKIQSLDIKKIKIPEDLNQVFMKLISSPNLASKAWVYRQYDHMVGTDTIIRPGSDAAVVRIKGTNKGISMTTDCNSRYCYLEPYWGAALAVAEAARNISASGAEPLAITDCLNFGNPERPEIMWQFEQAVLGISEACRRFNTPVVSGNVSFYNETSGSAIYPTPTIGMIGLMEDLKHHCTQWFKEEGDVIVLLGENTEELGGSEYLKLIHKKVLGVPPSLDFDRELAVQRTCLTGIRRGLVKSAHDVSEGGLAISLAECCITNPSQMLGATVELNEKMRHDSLLFGEGASRIIVTLSPGDVDTFMTIAKGLNCPAKAIGLVSGKALIINDWLCVALDKIHKIWGTAIPKIAGE